MYVFSRFKNEIIQARNKIYMLASLIFHPTVLSRECFYFQTCGRDRVPAVKGVFLGVVTGADLAFKERFRTGFVWGLVNSCDSS